LESVELFIRLTASIMILVGFRDGIQSRRFDLGRW